MVRCPKACPAHAGIVVVPQQFFRRSKAQLLCINHNSNDLDMVESSHGERPSLTIRLGLETPLTQTRDFLQLLEVFLIE